MKKERVQMSHDFVPLRDALEGPSSISDLLSNGEDVIMHYEEFREHNRKR